MQLRKSQMRIVSSWELDTIWNSSNCNLEKANAMLSTLINLSKNNYLKTLPECSTNVRIQRVPAGALGSIAACKSHTCRVSSKSQSSPLNRLPLFCRHKRRWQSSWSRTWCTWPAPRDPRAPGDRRRTRCPTGGWCCLSCRRPRACRDTADRRSLSCDHWGSAQTHRSWWTTPWWSCPRWRKRCTSRQNQLHSQPLWNHTITNYVIVGRCLLEKSFPQAVQCANSLIRI